MEKKLELAFSEIIKPHGNGKWASDTLHYLVFVKHKNEFNNLLDGEQWIVRNYLDGLTKIYG